tara:strand:- start:7162 stop:7698 length:537 start_codon:yes stop_codon:yes gene_type:complete
MVNQILKDKDFKFGLEQEDLVLNKIRKYFKDDKIKKNPNDKAFIDYYRKRKNGDLKYKIEVKSRNKPYYMNYEDCRAYSLKSGYELRSIIFGNNKMEEYREVLEKYPKCKCYILFNMYDKTFEKQNIFYYKITLDKINNKFGQEWIKEPNVWNKIRNDPTKNSNIGIKTEFLKPLDQI